MLRIISPTSLSTILQLLIDMADKYKVNRSENGGNKTNLSNLFTSKRSTGASYLTFGGAKKDGDNPKRGGGNTKKGVKSAKGSNYLTSDAQKTFNHLQYTFTPVLIF